MKRIFTWLMLLIGAFLFILAGHDMTMAKKPPWSGGPGDPKDYPPAPEPIALVLIGMGASGAAGYYLGKRKKK